MVRDVRSHPTLPAAAALRLLPLHLSQSLAPHVQLTFDLLQSLPNCLAAQGTPNLLQSKMPARSHILSEVDLFPSARRGGSALGGESERAEEHREAYIRETPFAEKLYNRERPAV